MNKLFLALLMSVTEVVLAAPPRLENPPGATPASVALKVSKSGDTMTGRLTAPDATLTYGVSAATAVITYVQASSITTTGGITAYGNVGVGGLPNATYKLQIGENTSSAGNPPLQQSLGGTYNGTVAGDATKSKLMVYYDGTSASGLGISSFGGRTQFEYASDFDHAFYGADTERMRLKTGGNLGIGTADPASKLHMSSGTLTVDGTGAEIKTTGTAVIASSTQVNGTLSVGEGTTADTVSGGSRMRIYDQTKPGLMIDGFSSTGASVLGGEVRLGSSGAYHGKLSFDGANAHMNIVNTYDNGDSRVQLVSRHTRVNASTATFTNGVLSITAPAATQAGFQPPVRTKAQIDAITPVDLGTIIICQNCSAPYSICVATGATLSGYRRSDSTTIGCGTNN